MSQPLMKLTATDHWNLAQWFKGGTCRPELSTPAVAQMITTLRFPNDAGAMGTLFAQDMEFITRYQLNEPPPAPPAPVDESEWETPPLPEAARLPADLPGTAGPAWLTDYLVYARRKAPMTPPEYLEANGIWLLSLAIARRVYIHLHTRIYGNLYVIEVGDTSVYRKSTGLKLVYELADQAMPHMRMPQQTTPEALIDQIAGVMPENYNLMTAKEQAIDSQGRRFSQQRGMVVDEISGLLAATKRDHMQGLDELLMNLYDGLRYVYVTRTRGKTVIEDGQLSILGATTPFGLIESVSLKDWMSGKLARYLMILPKDRPEFSLGEYGIDAPPELITRLKKLHDALPAPPNIGEPDRTQTSIAASIDQAAIDAYNRYYQYVSYDAIAEESDTDRRLRGNYTRMHIQAMKVALIAAVTDWVEAGLPEGGPRITLGNWAFGQRLAEDCRDGLHRLMYQLNANGHAEIGLRILHQLRKRPLPLWDLARRTGIESKLLKATLDMLMESGQVEMVERKGERGPAAMVYQTTEELPGNNVGVH